MVGFLFAKMHNTILSTNDRETNRESLSHLLMIELHGWMDGLLVLCMNVIISLYITPAWIVLDQEQC